MTDSLTGQPNRRYAFERIEQEWALAQRSGRPLACLIADVDHFKYINDACGHDIGDAMLRHVATLLRDAIPTRDVVCRLDGEEFLVICPDTDGEAASVLAERLRKRVQGGPLEIDSRLLPATVSVGVCVMDDMTANASELLKRTDLAVKSAKDAGRNCVRCWGTESKRLSLVAGHQRKA
jgi:diguanylate cyclase (GGDEF)-like protein